ncbi:hypothetical protein NOR_06054 [Metarhizium rileyi]|uniref:DNA/RNA-binding domain-containing protein n=1 Tax=Metarhizium rileyi (strain RCEF 4871) TaxID=1649241 RepID=A0A167BHT0_METRR|nr:hypothetical protein NOR_06054 [Metarhizium rileyi RCEF 4871]
MDKLTKGWVEHQRRVARQEAATRGSHCPLCQMELEPSVEAFKAHYTSKHPTADELDAIEALNNCALHSNDAVRTSDDDDFPRNRTSTDRQLWTADGGHGNSPQRPRMPQTRYGRGHSGQHRAQSPEPSDATADSADLPLLVNTELVPQPLTRKITSEELYVEVVGIYRGVVGVEKSCIELCAVAKANEIRFKHYRGLIKIHRAALHDHHDFLLATQHPAASPALRSLPAEHRIPARLWRHGIHTLLEVFRCKLPHSKEFMLEFAHDAYLMVALLYETIPLFRDTWSECLGDLGRYRMALETDTEDRNVWADVARGWYSKTSDKLPTVGRLHHHLAILARPNALKQLFYYAKSLCVPIPFHSTKDSVKTLFEPLLDMEPDATLEGVELVDAAFVRVHAVLFTDTHKDLLEPSMRLFLGLLDKRIGSEHGFFLETGYYIGISLSCLLLGFGDESNVLMKAIPKSQECMADESDDEEPEPSDAFWMAVSFTAQTFNLILTRSPDKNTWSCIHTLLVFYRFMVRFDAGKRYLEDIIPWEKFALLLNYLLRQTNNPRRLDTPVFPWPEDGQAKPLPEDYALRGCVYTEDYFPDKWFDNAGIEEQARCLELPSVAEQRRERLVWLGHGLAMRNERLHWNEDERQFFATESDNNNL